MKKFKKSLYLILVALLALSIGLTGCGGSEGKKAPTDGSQSTTGVSGNGGDSDDAAQHVSLVWYMIGNPQEDEDKVFSKVNEILKEKLNTTLELKYVSGSDYDTTMMTRMAASEVFDLCFTSHWTNKYNSNAIKGAYLPLDELLEKYGQNILAQTDKKFWDAIRISTEKDQEAKLYAIINKQFFGSDTAIWFKKDLVDKYNLREIIDNAKTLEDLEPAFAVIKENEPKVYPIGEMIAGPVREMKDRVEDIQGTPFAVYFNDPELKMVVRMLEPQEQTLMRLKRSWWEKGWIFKDQLASPDFTSLNKTGRFFCGMLGSSKPGQDVEKSNSLGFDVIGKSFYDQPVITVNSVTATLTAIPTTSKNPIRAMKLLDLIHTDKDLYNTLCWGLENVHYQKVQDNVIKLTGDYQKYFPNVSWAFGNNFNSYITDKDIPNRWELSEQLNNNGVFAPLFGFNLNGSNIRTELTQMSAIQQEFGLPLHLGAVDVDEQVARYLEQLKACGMEKAMVEIQKQLDVFKTTRKSR